MDNRWFWIISLVCLLHCANLFSQRYLIIERPGTIKNFKFQEGDFMHIEVISNNVLYQVRGELSLITQSSIIINGSDEYKLFQIKAIYRERLLVRIVHTSALTAGSGYIFLDCLNRGINRESPLVEKSTVVIGGSIIAGGVALMPFLEHKYKIGNRWRVKTIIFD